MPSTILELMTMDGTFLYEFMKLFYIRFMKASIFLYRLVATLQGINHRSFMSPTAESFN